MPLSMRRWRCSAPFRPSKRFHQRRAAQLLLTYANQYTKPFNEVTGVLTQMQTALAGAERLFCGAGCRTGTPDAPDALEPKKCEGAVRVENVAFSYTPKVPLIENFHLDVKPGQRIAIVGPTGCGKTTLINLPDALLRCARGRDLLDGNEIRTPEAERTSGNVWHGASGDMAEERHGPGKHRLRKAGCNTGRNYRRSQSSLCPWIYRARHRDMTR